VAGLSGVTAIAVGGYFACALLSSGDVQCWGDNSEEELGDGAGDFMTAVTVAGVSNVAAISVGENHACAVTAPGNVYCWGYNAYGQLGNGSTTTVSPPQGPVHGLSYTATAVAAGANHTCSVLSNGSTACWGNNSYGQLGNGTPTSSTTPVTVVW
jgi:alpha-tubulin suppressor-like RCC1 family protein